MSKEKKKILITGASRGIGKNIALKSKENGYIVIGTSTSKEGAQGLEKEGIHGLALNLNDSRSIEAVSYTHLRAHET